MNEKHRITRLLALVVTLLLNVASADPSTNVPPTITPTSIPVAPVGG